MNFAFQLFISVVMLLSITAFPSATVCAQESTDLASLQQRAQLYRDHIAKQQRNIQRMQQELKTNPKHPDAGKLGDFFATAAGVRTKAFDNEPEEIRKLIDKLEADPMLKALNATTMAQYPHNVAYGHFLVEIERSQKFIAMLRKQLRLTQTQIDAQSPRPTTTVSVPDVAPIIGRWKYVKGAYEIEISGSDGNLRGLIKASTPPEAPFPFDYKVNTTMFENGKLQPDGSYKVDWAQYSWVNSSLNKVLGRGSTPAVIRLRPDKAAFVATGKNRMYESKAANEKWLNEWGAEFKFSFIKLD